MASKTISIARDFSDTPCGRYVEDSLSSGERFRNEFLLPALKAGTVFVDIDGVEGYGSGFLEEAFGGLVREGYFTAGELVGRLSIVSSDADFAGYVQSIWRYITDAGIEKETPMSVKFSPAKA